VLSTKPFWNFDLLTSLPKKKEEDQVKKKKKSNCYQREKKKKKNLEIGYLQRNQQIKIEITSCSKHKKVYKYKKLSVLHNEVKESK
jgi:hypothetical protein